MRKPSYQEQLRHPKWQKKRLQILERAEWACEECGADDLTLHVHHSYYESGLLAWEYPDESLRAVCAECHRGAQDMLTLLHRQIGKIDTSAVDKLYGFALGLELLSFPNATATVLSREVADGIGRAWELTADEVLSATVEDVTDGYALDAVLQRKRQ